MKAASWSLFLCTSSIRNYITSHLSLVCQIGRDPLSHVGSEVVEPEGIVVPVEHALGPSAHVYEVDLFALWRLHIRGNDNALVRVDDRPGKAIDGVEGFVDGVVEELRTQIRRTVCGRCVRSPVRGG